MPVYETLMPIKTKGALPPLFCVHGEPLKMAMRIKADRPVYGLSHVYHSNFQDTVAETIEELARQYLSEVYMVEANGPYHLLGFSAGAMIAYEMARQVLNDGKQVASLTLIEPSLSDQAEIVSNRGEQLKNFVRDSGWGLATLSYLFRRIANSVTVRSKNFVDRIKVAVLLKQGKDLPEDLRWLGYLRALGPAIAKYDYQPITCRAILIYRELDKEVCDILNDFWPAMLGPGSEVRYAEGAHTHADFMLDPHLSNVSDLLDSQVLPPTQI